MQAVIIAARPNDSSPRVWASQIRSSTVPKRWCGRTLHQSWVASTIDSVAVSRSMKRTYARQSPNGSGTPQRGKVRVKISVRTEASPVSRPSRKGEFADRASSGGRIPRRWSQTAIARSAPRIPTWTWALHVLLRCATQRSSSRSRL